MAQSLFKRLKAADPLAAVDVVAPPWSAPLLARMPEVRRAWPLAVAHGELALARRRHLGLALRDHYSWAIVLPRSLKAALVPAVAAIPRRTGYWGEGRFKLLTDPRFLDRRLATTVQRFVALAEPPGTWPPPAAPHPRLMADPHHARATAEALGLALEQPVVVLGPGAEYGPAKRWPGEHFATLATRLAADGYGVWLLGSARDRPLASAIAAAVEGRKPRRGGDTGLVDLTGRTTLPQALDLLSLAAAVVCNDSGLMHLAAALERPVVALYGPSDPGHTPPLSDRAQTVALDLPCRPCHRRRCPLGHQRCLQGLLPDHVARHLALALAHHTP